MPKLRCPCGHVHNLSPIPDSGWVLVRDTDYETLISAEVRSETGGEPADAEYATLTHRMYECPHCNRLMWANNDDNYCRVFKLEDREA
jgi:hypothetical protein